MNLEGVMLSEESQTQKDKYGMILLVCSMLRIGKYIAMGSRITVTGAEGGGNKELFLNWYRVSVCKMKRLTS